ncbi:type VI secretion system Vgr family protein [Aquabacterium olei]|nr:type VI secretion system Vgr family protein [Aquabacterium olei]
MTDHSGIQHALGDAARSVLDGLLAELSAFGPSQHTRLLRLHTPLGPDVLLAERVQIHEGMGPGAALLPDTLDHSVDLHPAQPVEPPPTGQRTELLALSTRADLAPEDLLGHPILLELLTAGPGGALRPFHGHVTAFELLGADGGHARYRLRIEPWLAFLGHRTDAWVFQDMSVLDITEAVFADYAAQGKLMPAWRFDLADRSVYARRSLCVQFNESDLAFLQRLWAEEGLFTWFEHEGRPTDVPHLGRHTLVIADHNGAFRPNAQARVRFTQAGAVMKEDSLTRWHGLRRIGPAALHTASFDYRAVANHGASATSDDAHGQPFDLVHADQPGAYAYETPAQAERRAWVQMQSLDAARKRFVGEGTVRTLAPATTFTLLEHAEHDAGLLSAGSTENQFVVLGVVHEARNNLSADAQAGLKRLLGDAVLGALAAVAEGEAQANASDAPLYRARLTAQRHSVPVRAPMRGADGRLLHRRPVVHGAQTAVVVGLGEPVHTDRDGRVKVQFHWQRGAQGSHRLSAPADDNAPASAASGTWVRVAQDWSGQNWGSVFIPRLGQEVIVSFVDGDIDRPVVVGAAYNGQGADDAQGNQVAAGSATATGNAPAWFPGSQKAGELEGHAHTATLSGFKSQALDASKTGGGGHNQLVLDDTPGQGRLLAHTTQHQTWLQIGHLLQQHDNQRLAHRGHGLELHTLAQGALRAASGLHLSSFARPGGTSAQARPMDTREAQAQLTSHAALVRTLAGNARTHLANLPNEADADKLPAHQALQATVQSLKGTEGNGQGSEADGASGDVVPIGGGHGSIPVTERPDLVVSAAGDIAGMTPAHAVLSAGQHTTLSAAQDTNLLAQRHQAWAVKDGISLFTRGEAKNEQRAVKDVGMKLHAASGNVNVQAQSGAFSLTALKSVDVQSTAADVVISAPSRIVLNGGGGYVKIDGGNIEIGTSGMAQFKAAMKELTSGGSASASFSLTKPGTLALPLAKHLVFSTALDVHDVFFGKPIDNLEFTARFADGSFSHGRLESSSGKTPRIGRETAEVFEVLVGSDGAWAVVGDDGDYRSNTGELHHDEDDADGDAS